MEEDSEELDDEEIKVLNRATLKFCVTETTQALFREYNSIFYDEKEAFADLPILGQKCSSHGNEWSDENPVEMDWCFSVQVDAWGVETRTNRLQVAHPKERGLGAIVHVLSFGGS